MDLLCFPRSLVMNTNSTWRRSVISLPANRLPGLFVRLFVLALISLSLTARAQDTEPTDRVYKHSKVEVEKALQSLDAYATNRLPVLDGFVNAKADTLVRFENP